MEFTQHATGLSLGNLVDGLPGALHTEALWGGQGVFGPAAIGTLAKKNIVILSTRMFNFPNNLMNFKNV